jgi:hypothetical protein
MDAGKVFGKNSPLFLKINSNKTGIEGNFLNKRKAIYEKPSTNVTPALRD